MEDQSKYHAKCLGEKIATFIFICCIRVWYDILNKVNFVSKILQSSSMNLQLALDVLNYLNQFLNDYRSDEIFRKIVENSKLIAKKFHAETVVKRTHNLITNI